MQVHCSQVPFDRIDEVWMERQAVEVPRPVGELLDAAELVAAEPGEVGRVCEVLGRLREVEPEGLLGGPELARIQKALHQAVAMAAHVLEALVRDPHRFILSPSRTSTCCPVA
jgi:hypothetical protein